MDDEYPGFCKTRMTELAIFSFTVLEYTSKGGICQIIKRFDCSRRMDRGARLGVNQGESEGPVSAEAPPWQGVKMLVAAK